MELCLKNGELLQTCTVSIQDRAFQYGDGCFTTAKIQHSCILLWQRHLQRLKRDCEKLHLMPNWYHIEQLVDDLRKTGLFDTFALTGTIKIMISRGEGQRGYGFDLEKKSDVYVLFYPSDVIKPAYSEIRAGVLEQVISPELMPALVGVKSLNRLEQILLKHEANRRNLDEAIVLDTQGKIVEGMSSNCFLYLNDHWYTPALRMNGIQGVMRAEILSRMHQLGLGVHQVDISKHVLAQVDGMFFCNALNPMQAVREFSGRSLNVLVARKLFNMLKLEQI